MFGRRPLRTSAFPPLVDLTRILYKELAPSMYPHLVVPANMPHESIRAPPGLAPSVESAAPCVRPARARASTEHRMSSRVAGALARAGAPGRLAPAAPALRVARRGAAGGRKDFAEDPRRHSFAERGYVARDAPRAHRYWPLEQSVGEEPVMLPGGRKAGEPISRSCLAYVWGAEARLRVDEGGGAGKRLEVRRGWRPRFCRNWLRKARCCANIGATRTS